MSEFATAIKAIGVSRVAVVCGVSERAVYKWMAEGAFPRTEYTQETFYATRIAEIAGGEYTAAWLLAKGARGKAA